MQLADDSKHCILERLMDTLAGIASREYQKRVWIKGFGPEVDDFDETCNFFSDDCDFVIENYKEFAISKTQCQLLIEFREVFSKFYKKNHWPQLFMDNPEWTKINEMAEEILEAFNYKERLR